MLERSKTEVFTREGGIPVSTQDGLIRAGKFVNGNRESGLIYYGIPIGTVQAD